MRGIAIIESIAGARPVLARSLAVIGLVATAADADAEIFPIGEPVLITNIRAAISKAGDEGTLVTALSAIAAQTSPSLIVVRVADSADAEEAELAAIAGVEQLIKAESKLGIRPRILGAPGLDSQAVTAALVTAAQRLRGSVYARANADSTAEALLYRDEFGARELMLIWPEGSGGDGQAVASVMGVRARLDAEIGYHKTVSNTEINGLTGLTHPIDFDLMDQTCEAALLNAGEITTIVQMQGRRVWGNRTCSDDPRFAFESAVRTNHALQDILVSALGWAVDKPITPALVRDMEETVAGAFAREQAAGRIVGARVWFDPASNSAASLSAGQVALDYEYTPAAPAEGITLTARITDRFYASLVS